MPRSAKDSEEEVDVKTAGRKTRLTDVGSADTSLRRSSRIKLVKQNDSSPESNDSNVSNTHTRVTRKRTGTMDNSTATEKQRVLRSRRNSVSSDVSETTEVDATTTATPTKRNRHSIVNDMLNKTSSQRIKRFTRAGSESKSPPSRVTRNTRATSMEPETNAENKLIQRDEHELTRTPRTRRRTSIIPSEATVIEEKEETLKILMVTLDRTLPNVNESKETDSNDSIKLEVKNESVSNIEDTPDTKNSNINEEDDKDNISENPPPKSVESVEKDISIDDKNITPNNDKNVLEESKNLLVSTGTEMNSSQSFSEKITNDDKNVSEETKSLLTSTAIEMNSSQSFSEKITNDDKNVPEENKALLTSAVTEMNSSQSFSEKITNDDKNVPEENKALLTSAVTEMDTSMHSSSQSFSQKADQNTSKELGLKIENLLTNSIEKHEDFSNKENLAANVISDEPNNENTGSNTPVQSPKPLSVSNSNKLIKEKSKSPCNLSSRSRHSKSSESMDDSVVKEVDNDVANNSVAENLNASAIAEDTDNSDMPKLAIESDSLSGTTLNTSPDRNISLKICSDSSSCDSIELVRCTDDAKSPDNSDKFTENNEETTEVHDKECKEIEMDATSNVEKPTNTNEDSGMDTIKEETNISDKDNVKEEVVKPCTSDSVQDDDKMNRTNTSSSLASPDKSLITSTEFSTNSENKDTSELKSINEADTASSNTNIVLQPLNDRISPEDSIPTNTDEDSVTNTVKSSLSSTVAETPVEVTEGKPEKEDLSVNDTLSSKDQPLEKSVEQKSESTQETCTKNQESMNVDDNDSDKNAVNLFQDIPANEWKEKNADTDKNSIHSLSTERMEHETEAECDLVLVDKEAWLAAESMKAEKEAEASDYDSDDTVVLKMQRDSMKGQNNVRMEMDTSADNNKMNVSKESATNKSNVDNKNVTKNTKDSKNENKSMTEEQNKHSTSKHNVSNQKSTKEKDLNESHKTMDTEDTLSIDKSNLSEDTSKKRKSLDKSVREVDEIESIEKQKSLNKSTEEEKGTADTELDSGSDIITSAKKSKGKRSLNISSKKQVNRSKGSDNDCKESSLPEKRKSTTKKKFGKTRSPARNVISDSESESNSDASQNSTIELPNFLMGEASNTDSNNDNESNKSIDSDIEKEYNLDGKDTCKFSDDDVPGDECRASETESSDPDDNGSDLADFVVYDDVEEEEEEEEEDGSEESENEETNNIAKKVKEDTIEKETKSENEEENDEADVSIDTSVKRKSKLKKSDSLNTSDIAKSDNKKQKSKKIDTSQTEKNEKENSLSDASLSRSFKMKKPKQKRIVNEFIVEDIEQPLNDSYSTFNKKTQKLSKCSTPKSHYLPTLAECDVNIKTINVSDSKINVSADKKKVEDTMSKTENRFTKLSKQKSKENLVDTHLPSELAELVENADLSKPLPSKIAELNKTTSVLDSDTPTTKYLKKDKLNDSAPVLKFDSKLTKTKTLNDDEQNKILNQLEEESEDVITHEINTSLKQKVLKVADNILEVDRRKKPRKRKQKVENSNPDKFIADDFQEDAPQILIESENIVSTTNTDKNEDIEEVVLNEGEKKKKKKKKKQKLALADITEQVNENIESESTKKLVPKKVKKKKEKEIVENVPDTYSENQISGKKKKKSSVALLNEEIATTQISKKKQKSSSEDTTSPTNEMTVAKLPKRKKKLLEDVILQYEEVPSKKRKKNLSPNDFSESENISIEKVPKKKHKLLDEKKNKAKSAKTTNTLQQSNDVVSDSDEGPTVVTFSEARDEALKIIKHTADSIKANKEMKKKKRKENVEKIQRDDEFKNEKQKLRKQEIKVKETDIQKRGIKRLPDKVLENLSDIPFKSLKKRKISKREEQILPSRTMFNSENKKVKNTYEDDFVPLSFCGATTKFAVANIQKIKTKKKIAGVVSFKQKMLARNSRQPVSAYLMYLKKQKISGNDNFCNKPY